MELCGDEEGDVELEVEGGEEGEEMLDEVRRVCVKNAALIHRAEAALRIAPSSSRISAGMGLRV